MIELPADPVGETGQGDRRYVDGLWDSRGLAPLPGKGRDRTHRSQRYRGEPCSESTGRDYDSGRRTLKAVWKFLMS